MKLFLVFVLLNILNVILQTVKSICTIKCGKIGAALINAIAFGLYTVVLVYMNCDLTTGTKAMVVAICNLIGVYIVKVIEEKIKKDKIWKIEFCTNKTNLQKVCEMCEIANISYNILDLCNSNKQIIFNFFCKTQEETDKAHKIVDIMGGHYFITETKSF